MIVPFRTMVDRIHDISLEEGTTVKQLADILKAGGFDIDRDTQIQVERPESRGGILAGKVGGYRLQQGDCVLFKTRSISCSAMRNAIEEAIAKKHKEEEERQRQNVCTCGRSVTINGVTITPVAGGVMIKING